MRLSTNTRSANDRLKSSWSGWLTGSVLFAAALHAGVLVFWPQMQVEVERVTRFSGASLENVALRGLPQVEVPAPPAEIVAPALPTVSDLELSDALPAELEPPTFDEPAPLDAIAAPELAFDTDWIDYERFAPFIIRPVIRNEHELDSFLMRHYEPIAEVTGFQGTVKVAFWIDERGAVERAQVTKSSGSSRLDRIAESAGRFLRFSPAMRAGRPVKVLVQLPFEFRHGD